VAANSPFFLGKQLHHETRIALFEQSIDTRTEELASQGVRPRVWFGEKWLSEGIFELFDENVRYYPSLLPICEEEDPQAMLRAGDIPHLPELSLHNGTIYRWNRPVYDVARGRPHLRIENRVLPAGPTVVDSVANTAFYYGLLAGSRTRTPDLAVDELRGGDRELLLLRPPRPGREAVLAEGRERGSGHRARAPAPAADRPAGPRELARRCRPIDRWLGVIEQRVLAGQNGASWQIATYHRLIEHDDYDRPEATAELVRRYQALSRAGEPVHTWKV
jgi:hypothetical protein